MKLIYIVCIWLKNLQYWEEWIPHCLFGFNRNPVSLRELLFFCYLLTREESESVIHSDDAFAPVGFLCFKKIHVEDKDVDKVSAS